jgi:uncharacterized alpha-E superfamily protein
VIRVKYLFSEPAARELVKLRSRDSRKAGLTDFAAGPIAIIDSILLARSNARHVRDKLSDRLMVK